MKIKTRSKNYLIAGSKDIPSSTHSPQEIASLRVCVCLLPYFPSNGARNSLMSTHASILVDYVGPPSAEVCRTAAISLRFIELREVEVEDGLSQAILQLRNKKSLVSPTHLIQLGVYRCTSSAKIW